MSALQPPRIDTDQGANTHLPDASDTSSDHFSSASEGAPHSPIPITRVERVDDEPAHGEVPGTPAYNQRTQDAVPDEIEIIPESQPSRSRASSTLGSRPQTPAGGSPGRGSPVPKTVVEKVDFTPSYGEVDGTPAKDMRMADAMPDEIRKAPEETRRNLDGRYESESRQRVGDDDESEESRQQWFRSMWEGERQPELIQNAQDEDEDGFGDDFDEFAEGGGGGDDDDFGDFDEATPTIAPQQSQQQQDEPPPAVPPSTAPDILARLPSLASLTNPSVSAAAIEAYINAILPDAAPFTQDTPPRPPLDPSEYPAFTSSRSLSLWQQLVSPPPMQPPNWTRSKIRRLFLVSLGVPVDLDEILPPSKQKRLILPYTPGPRASTAIERLKDEGNNDTASMTSLDSKTGDPKPKRPSKRSAAAMKGPLPPPDLDLNATSLLCSTTPEALSGFTDAELRQHVDTLQVLNSRASTVLEYWLQRKDEGLKEKEALEGVVGNLVGFVKGRRGR